MQVLITVVGELWMGGVASTEYKLTDFAIPELAEWTTDDIGEWIDTHSGDFAKVIGWQADKIVTMVSSIKEFTDAEYEAYCQTVTDEYYEDA